MFSRGRYLVDLSLNRKEKEDEKHIRKITCRRRLFPPQGKK